MRVRIAFAATFALGVPVSAQGLVLEYCVEDMGGLYEYHFTLKPDAGWQPGMGWAWLIFGDEPCFNCVPAGTGVSPIADFQMTSPFPVGPWTGLTATTGQHNGPTLDPPTNFWIPASASETLTWSGTSTANLAQGQLRFSTKPPTLGGATPALWETAALVPCSGTCYADCDGSGILDLFDFLCFVNEFNAGDPYADCDGNGGLDLFDFLCFVNEFNQGCP